jgi:hypothetical protein
MVPHTHTHTHTHIYIYIYIYIYILFFYIYHPEPSPTPRRFIFPVRSCSTAQGHFVKTTHGALVVRREAASQPCSSLFDSCDSALACKDGLRLVQGRLLAPLDPLAQLMAQRLSTAFLGFPREWICDDRLVLPH